MDRQDSNVQAVNQGMPVMLIAQPIEADEFSIFDLWRALVRRKGMIALIATIATAIGLLNALLASPVYQTSIILSPPAEKDISALQPIEYSVENPQAEPDFIFGRYMKYLQLKSVQREFFLHHGVVDALAPDAKTATELREAVNSFGDSIDFKDDTLTLTGSDPKLIADWLNDFVHVSEISMVESLTADFNSALQHRIDNLKLDVVSKLKMAIHGREDRIVQIREALSIAKVLGISDYRLSPTITSNKELDGKVSVSSQDTPLYLRGTKSLQAELDALQRRKDDRAFIPGLSETELKITLLEARTIKPDNIHVMRVDEIALPPKKSFKPKRKLIVLTSLLIGIILGILVAFIAEASTRTRGEGKGT